VNIYLFQYVKELRSQSDTGRPVCVLAYLRTVFIEFRTLEQHGLARPVVRRGKIGGG